MRQAIEDKQMLCYLTALSLTLSVIESSLPHALPFLRLGLANLALLYALERLSTGDYFLLAFFKWLLSSLLSGLLFSPFSLVSLAGNAASAVLMLVLYRTLAGRLISREDNAVVAMTTVNIRRVMKLPDNVDFSSPAEVTLADGKKFFPVGIYAGIGWNFRPEELVNSGFNVIHTYATNRRDVDKGDELGRKNNLKLLDEARKLGAYVMIQLPHDYTEKSGEAAKLPSWLDVYRHHPAVFGYYVDETRSIKNTPYPIIKAAYDQVRAHDPVHRWFAYEGPDPNLRDCMDAIIYNVSNPNAVTLCMLNLGPEKPVIHCYGQKDFQAQSATSLDYNQSNFVMPVIWGASGIFYWWMPNLEGGKEGNLEYRKLAPRVLNSFKRFSEIAPALISGETLPDWTKQIQTEGAMEHKLFARQGKVYIFCGVANGSPKNGTIRLPIPAGRTLRDVLNDQQLEANNEFLLKLHPGQGRIIEVK